MPCVAIDPVSMWEEVRSESSDTAILDLLGFPFSCSSLPFNFCLCLALFFVTEENDQISN